MAQRHRGGNARFARVDLSSVFGIDLAQIEQIHFEHGFLFDAFAHGACDAKRFRHFARARFIGAWRSGNQEDARLATVIHEALLSFLNGRACLQPLEREFVLWISKLRPSFPRLRIFATVVVGLPCEVRESLNFGSYRVESRIRKLSLVASFELCSWQFGRTLSSSNRGDFFTHRGIPLLARMVKIEICQFLSVLA